MLNILKIGKIIEELKISRVETSVYMFKEPETYITLKKAAKISGYHSDYIGYLIRKGEIKGRKTYGNSAWFVNKKDLLVYQEKKHQKRKNLIYDIIPPIQEKVSSWMRTFQLFLKTSKYAVVLILFSIVAFGALIVLAFPSEPQIRTKTVKFYPNQCQGGWENPQNAQGVPELGEGTEISEFNETNSSVLRNAISQIFCEGFEGETPSETVIKNVSLKFSWMFKKEDVKIIDLPSVPPVQETEEEILTLEPTREPSPVIEPSSLPSETILSDAFLEILYTVDGESWQSLGKVNQNNWQNLSLEVPVFNWEDLGKIQIGIRSVPVLDSVVLVVYLDSVWIEVEYQKVVEYQEVSEDPFIPPGEKEGDIILSEVLYEEMIAVDEDIAISEPLNPQLPPIRERRFDKKVRIAKDARHSCAAKNFRIDISGQGQTITEFTLDGDRSDIEKIKIGSLPLGIDITFLNNAAHEYSPARKDDVFVLQIINQLGSQKGDFNIPILYTSGNETMICQMNVINMD